jgi:hypothetical protein
MKNIYILIGVYIVALTVSIYGFMIDKDPIINSFAYQIFEIIMLSGFVFGILMLPVYLFYFVFRHFNKRIKSEN